MSDAITAPDSTHRRSSQCTPVAIMKLVGAFPATCKRLVASLLARLPWRWLIPALPRLPRPFLRMDLQPPSLPSFLNHLSHSITIFRIIHTFHYQLSSILSPYLSTNHPFSRLDTTQLRRSVTPRSKRAATKEYQDNKTVPLP
jgi:hypothetical protein